MLDTMRDLSKSLVSKALMILLVISFGVWGVGDILRSNGPSYAVKVGGDTISVSEFQQQRQLVSRQMETLGIKNLPKGQLEMSVIRQLVQQKLTLMAMHDMGLVVNDALVGKIIADLPDFKGKDGKFDGKLFKSIVERNGMSEKAFLAQFKRDAAGRFLTDSLEMRDATAPASVLALEAMISGETRDAVILTIPARDAMDEANVTAMKEFYEANKENYYLNPENRTLEYVVLTPAEIDALIDKSITAAMVDEAAAAKPDLAKALIRMKLKTQQRDDVLRTLGNSIEDELAAGKTMGEAFAKAGISATPRLIANATPELAKTSTDDVIKTVAEQGFSLSEGEISRLISTQKGTLLMVSAKKINAAAPKGFDEVKADVKARMGKQLAREAARAKAVTVKAELAKSPNWQAVANEQKIASRVVSRIARPTQEKPAMEGLPLALQQAIFERAMGEIAGPLTLENGDQVLALVTASHLPEATAKPSEKDSSHISEKLAQDVQNRAYQSFSESHTVKVNPAIMGTQATEE